MLLIYIITFVTMFISVYFLLAFYENVDSLKSRISNWRPKVSIIIPAYNEEKRISNTLEGVLKLDYPKDKLEILVVDDGSTDNTKEVAERYEDQGVKVLHKENEGCKAHAANYGIKHASGDIIWTLDADCRPEKDVLKKCLSYLEDEETVCVVPAVKVWKPRTFWERVQVVEYSIAIFMRKTLHFLDSQVYANASPIVKKEFFDKHGGFEPGVAEDLELGMRVHAKGYKLAHAIDTAVYAAVPYSFRKLSRQRIRWLYGLYENVSKYKKLFALKYGQVGLFYLPLALGYALLPIYMMFRAIGGLFQQGSKNAARFSGIGMDVSYAVGEFKNITIHFRLIYFVVAILIVLGIMVYITANHYGRIRKNYPLSYLFYAFVYLWILGVYDLIALVLYIFKREPGWYRGLKRKRGLST